MKRLSAKFLPVIAAVVGIAATLYAMSASTFFFYNPKVPKILK